jgi:hypothetical protein
MGTSHGYGDLTAKDQEVSPKILNLPKQHWDTLTTRHHQGCDRQKKMVSTNDYKRMASHVEKKQPSTYNNHHIINGFTQKK